MNTLRAKNAQCAFLDDGRCVYNLYSSKTAHPIGGAVYKLFVWSKSSSVGNLGIILRTPYGVFQWYNLFF